MNEYNDSQITNEQWKSNDIRYTNDDVPYNEYSVARDNSTATEFGTYSGAGNGEGSSRFRNFDATKIASTFAVVAVVAMAVVIDDSPFGEFFNPITGIISEGFGIGDSGYSGDVYLDYVVTDNEIRYYVSFSEDPGSDAKLYVSNTFTGRTYDLTVDTDGTIGDLRAGMKYTLDVKVDGKTVLSKNVTTLSVYDEAPIFVLVYAKCYCEVDETFKFKFDVVDRNSVWSGYIAKLVYETPQGQMVAVCDFVEPVTGGQVISTANIPEDIREAKLVIMCQEKSGDSEITKTLYNETVKI